VLNMQLSVRKPFGKLAVDMGLLEAQNIGELLAIQRKSRPPIGELLVEMGAVARDAMDTELEAFRGTDEKE